MAQLASCWSRLLPAWHEHAGVTRRDPGAPGCAQSYASPQLKPHCSLICHCLQILHFPEMHLNIFLNPFLFLLWATVKSWNANWVVCLSLGVRTAPGRDWGLFPQAVISWQPPEDGQWFLSALDQGQLNPFQSHSIPHSSCWCELPVPRGICSHGAFLPCHSPISVLRGGSGFCLYPASAFLRLLQAKARPGSFRRGAQTVPCLFWP